MVAMLLAIAALRWKSSTEELRISVQASTQAANETLTRVFANEHWNAVSALLPPPGSNAEAVRANAGTDAIDQIVRRFSRTTDVLKVKIYRLDGMTLYSSDRAQIGEDKATNQGFQTAARGQPVSELTTRGRFGGFDGELYDRDLVASYVPLRQQGRIVAVLEIYSDRTDSIALIGSEVRQLGATMLPVLAAMLVLVTATGVVLHRMQARLPRQADAEAKGDVGPARPVSSRLPTDAWAPGVQQPVSAAIAALAAQYHLLLDATPDTDGTDAPQARPVRAMQGPVRTMVNWADTVDHLQRLAQAHSGPPVAPTNGPFSIDALLDGLVGGHEALAAAKGLNLIQYKYPQAMGDAAGDVSAIGQLLHHLLGSAVDATDEGRIELKATRTAAGMRVDVIDSSPGLPQSLIDELCVAWDTGLLAAPGEAGLSGLRLVLCHALARQLGGRAEFRSTPGHGSRLSVEIPLAGV